MNEQRRELEFLEGGGNLLDFDFTSNGIIQKHPPISGPPSQGAADHHKEKAVLHPRNGETLASERDGSRTASTSGQENRVHGNGLWRGQGVVSRDSTSPERLRGTVELGATDLGAWGGGNLEPGKKEGIGVLPNGLLASATEALLSAGARAGSVGLSETTNGSHVTGGFPSDVAMLDVSMVPLTSPPVPGADLSSVKLPEEDVPQVPALMSSPIVNQLPVTVPPRAPILPLPAGLSSGSLVPPPEVALVVAGADPHEKKRSHHGGSVGVMHGARLGDKGVPMPWEQTEGGLLAREKKRLAMIENAKRAQEDCILEEAEILKVKMTKRKMS